MKKILCLLLIITIFLPVLSQDNFDTSILVGAQNYDEYKPLLIQKKIGVVVNHTSTLGEQHLVDFLLENNHTITTIFAPEHGFRGGADAGETVLNSTDSKTGLPIVSLYGKNKKPTPTQLQNIDVMIFDIQDVGARFYTYISTMHYVMEACAEQNIPLIILDRPNPNGHYVDGPILDLSYQSFVGLHPIPIVHGLTVGELAYMINGEKWLNNKVQCEIYVIKNKNYTHKTFYNLPIAPSPNLPNMHSVYLYPSLCLFEATKISVGRGTNLQFQVLGSPKTVKGDFTFTPKSKQGAKNPLYENIECKGLNLSTLPIIEIQKSKFTLTYLMLMYENYSDKELFFNSDNFFEKLSGNNELRSQIKKKMLEQEIRKTWESDLEKYKTLRKKYLLYPDFDE